MTGAALGAVAGVGRDKAGLGAAGLAAAGLAAEAAATGPFRVTGAAFLTGAVAVAPAGLGDAVAVAPAGLGDAVRAAAVVVLKKKT